METSSPWIELSRLAEAQQGHVAAWQARLLRISADALAHRASSTGWTAVHRGVWRLAGVPRSRRGDLWAAILCVAPIVSPRHVEPANPAPAHLRPRDVMVTGWSAADVYGFDGWRPTRPQLLTAAARYSARPGIRLVRSRLPVAPYLAHRDGLPLATPPRMAWDAAHLCAVGDGPARRHLNDLLIDLDRRRLLAVAEVLSVVDEPAAHSLASQVPAPLRVAASILRPGFSHSATEARARRIATRVCRRMGLTLHPRPLLLRHPDGHPLAEVDLAIPEIRFGTEIDGPHHEEPRVRAADLRRDRRLRDVLAWTITRHPVAHVDEGDLAFERRYQQALHQHLLRANAAAA